jgi:thioredoxin-dependent peroxiredoxin
MTNSLNVGDPAPTFTLASTGGGTVSLQEFRGRNVILYFYPMDDTPGCTTEASNFRDAHDTISQRDAVVLGISPDDVAKHERFASKYHLPFPLLADPDHAVAEAYGAWTEKSRFGRTYMGIVRSTFLIGGDGNITAIWRQVKVDGHVEQVMEALST